MIFPRYESESWIDWLGLGVVIGGGYVLLLVWALS